MESSLSTLLPGSKGVAVAVGDKHLKGKLPEGMVLYFQHNHSTWNRAASESMMLSQLVLPA